MVSQAELEANLDRVRARVAAAAARAGRDPAEVAVMAVTKGQPGEALRMAAEAGLRLFGENRVQEAGEKVGAVPAGCELHLIGHLQRNKAARAGRMFACVHSIDRLDTALALSRAAVAASRTVDVLLEWNTSGVESQSGYRDAGLLLDEIGEIAGLAGLRVRGLMTIAPSGVPESRLRAAFAGVRELQGRCRAVVSTLDVLSMGMSGDFEPAVEEGATIVRLGTVLFGERNHV